MLQARQRQEHEALQNDTTCDVFIRWNPVCELVGNPTEIQCLMFLSPYYPGLMIFPSETPCLMFYPTEMHDSTWPIPGSCHRLGRKLSTAVTHAETCSLNLLALAGSVVVQLQYATISHWRGLSLKDYANKLPAACATANRALPASLCCLVGDGLARHVKTAVHGS